MKRYRMAIAVTIIVLYAACNKGPTGSGWEFVPGTNGAGHVLDSTQAGDSARAYMLSAGCVFVGDSGEVGSLAIALSSGRILHFDCHLANPDTVRAHGKMYRELLRASGPGVSMEAGSDYWDGTWFLVDDWTDCTELAPSGGGYWVRGEKVKVWEVQEIGISCKRVRTYEFIPDVANPGPPPTGSPPPFGGGGAPLPETSPPTQPLMAGQVLISPGEIEATVGEYPRFYATVLAEDSVTVLSNYLVSWGIDAGTVASKDDPGMYHTLSAGTATVTATVQGRYGPITASAFLLVLDTLQMSFDDTLSEQAFRPSCPDPFSRMNQSWCDAVRGQRDSLSPALRARVDSAIATIRGRGNNCVALADEAQAEWNRGDLRFGLPIKDDTIVGNPNQPTGGASKGDASQGESYTVIDMKFLAKNYDKARKTQIISGGVVLGNGDLSVLIAHEMDHRINKAPHIENNPLKTPLAFSCSDLHS